VKTYTLLGGGNYAKTLFIMPIFSKSGRDVRNAPAKVDHSAADDSQTDSQTSKANSNHRRHCIHVAIQVIRLIPVSVTFQKRNSTPQSKWLNKDEVETFISIPILKI